MTCALPSSATAWSASASWSSWSRVGKDGADCEITVFCEEPRPAYDRVQLTSFFSGKTRADLNVVPDRILRRSTAITLRLNDSVLAHRPGRTRSCARRATRKCPTTSWCSRPAPIPFVPPVPGTRPARLLRLSHHRGPRGHRAPAAQRAQDRRGHRRRTARSGSRQGAAGSRPRDAHRRVRAAPDGGAARRLPAAGCCAGKIEALGVRVHLQKSTKEIVDGDSAQAQAGVRRRHQPGDRPHRVLRGHPAARRARARRRPRGRRARRHPHQRRTARPPIPTSTPSANARCGTGASSAWSRPATRWPKSRRATCSAKTQLQFLGADMSTKLKLMGVDVCSIGDAHGSAPGALNYVFTDEAAGVYKKLVVAERPQAAAGRDPGRRRDRLRHAAADGAQRRCRCPSIPRN